MTLILSKRFPDLSPAPKDPRANRSYRRKVWTAGRVSEEFRQDCWARAKGDHTWFVDTFGWTENAKEHPDTPYRPFILRDYQEDLSALLIRSVGVHDVAIPKARDMGATWTALTVVEWLWQFYDYQRIHMGSSKQELVDKLGDPRSLFWKIDFFYRMLPKWLRPLLRPDDRKLNSFTNPSTESTVTGEATNPNFGRAARPGIALLDEFAAVEDDFAVLSATRDSTKTRWFISTFQGAYGAFFDRVDKMSKNEPENVFWLHWSKHPDKRRGLYTSHLIKKDGKDVYVLEILDHDYPWTRNADGSIADTYTFDLGNGKTITRPFTLDGNLRSPWYDYQYERSGSPQEIAQELDMKAQESGWQFMPTHICETVARKHARPPLMRGHLIFEDPMSGELRWEDDPKGPVQIWVPLTNQLLYSGEEDVGVGCDIATGVSEKGSNSVGAFYGAIGKEKVAQLTMRKTPPHNFADYVLALCRFFSGPLGPALLNWEDAGPGELFRTQVVEVRGYRRLWMRRDQKQIDAEPTNVPGWKPSKTTKRNLLGNYKTALLEDRFINRCHEAIMECSEYITNPDLSIEHSGAMSSQDRNDQGENHGDMVIADALAYLALNDLPGEVEVPDPVIPEHSFAGRKREAQAKRQKTRGSW